MNRFRLITRVAVIASVLGLQAWAIFPFNDTRKERAWPFVPYPMYSGAHRYGERLGAPSLAGVACRGGAVSVLGPDAIGASTRKHFWRLVGGAASPAGAADRTRIAALANRVTPGRWCGFEVRYDSAAVSRDGMVRLARSPAVVARWTP